MWEIGKEVGLNLAGLLENVFWVLGKKSMLERKQVRYACMTRYYDCAKAKRRLGYRPLVGLQEGIERSVRWFMEKEKKEGEKKTQ